MRATVVVLDASGALVPRAWIAPFEPGAAVLPPRRTESSPTIDPRGRFGDDASSAMAVPIGGIRVVVGAAGHVSREVVLSPASTEVRLEAATPVLVRVHYGASPFWVTVRDVAFHAAGDATDVVLCDPVELDPAGEARLILEARGEALCVGRAVYTHGDGSSSSTTVYLVGSGGSSVFDLRAVGPGEAIDVRLGARDIERLRRLREP